MQEINVLARIPSLATNDPVPSHKPCSVIGCDNFAQHQIKLKVLEDLEGTLPVFVIRVCNSCQQRITG